MAPSGCALRAVAAGHGSIWCHPSETASENGVNARTSLTMRVAPRRKDRLLRLQQLCRFHVKSWPCFLLRLRPKTDSSQPANLGCSGETGPRGVASMGLVRLKEDACPRGKEDGAIDFSLLAGLMWVADALAHQRMYEPAAELDGFKVGPQYQPRDQSGRGRVLDDADDKRVVRLGRFGPVVECLPGSSAGSSHRVCAASELVVAGGRFPNSGGPRPARDCRGRPVSAVAASDGSYRRMATSRAAIDSPRLPDPYQDSTRLISCLALF